MNEIIKLYTPDGDDFVIVERDETAYKIFISRGYTEKKPSVDAQPEKKLSAEAPPEKKRGPGRPKKG